MKQRTIAKEVRFAGKALQTGKHVVMTCRPGIEGEGIVFTRTDIADAAPIKLGELMSSSSNRRRTTIGLGKVQVQTVEHLLAALWALGIDNLIIDIAGAELPAMDGSALGFLTPLKEAGTTEQGMERRSIKITEPIMITNGDRSISIVPDDVFSVSYSIDYKVACIGKEEFHIVPDMDSFEKDIAPARTFCLMREAALLFLTGLGRGATFNNTLILGNKGPVGTKFRIPNEPIRHKILDLIGDLYMLGRPIIGKVIAKKSGHALNAEVVKQIAEKYI